MSCVACGSSSDDNAGGSGAPSIIAGNPGGGNAGTIGSPPAGSAGTNVGAGGTTAPGAGTGAPSAGTGAPTAGTGAGGTTGGMAGTDGPPPAAADSWRMMGYDENNTYFNPGEKTISVANAGTLVEKWRKTVSGFPPGSPIIADGKVFVMATGATYAFDLNTGDQLWMKAEINGTASLAYDQGFIYAHAGPTAELYKLNAGDGSVVWGPVKTYDLASCDGTSSPIVAGGKVVVGHSCGVLEVTAPTAARGGVEAFDAATGMRAWTYWTVNKDGPEDGAMVWSTVAIDMAGGTVFAATGNNYTTAGPGSDAIHAIDLASGMKKWVKQVRANDVWSLTVVPGGEDTDFGANPILATVGGKKVVAAGDKGSAFWQLDRESGNIDWSRNNMSASHTAQNGGILMNGAFDGTHFYAISNDPTGRQAILRKLDPMNMGADAWMKAYPKIVWGAPSLANGVLFAPINDDLYVLNAADGAMLTMFNTGGSIAAGAAAVAQGHVVVGSGLSYAFGFGDAINNNQVICYGLP